MPEMDGYTQLREVRNLPDQTRAAIPAIAVSAFGREEDEKRSIEAGFAQHHSKPLDPVELRHAVRNLVRECTRSRPA